MGIKKNLIDKYPYFKGSYKFLEEEKADKILVFGVSFKNDDHIFNALCFNKNLKEVFLTYKSKKDLERFRQKISQVCSETQDCSKKFKFVKINVDNCIWVNNDIDDLVKSVEYKQTHKAISRLNSQLENGIKFSKDEITDILKALLENSRINSIIPDDDVNNFYKKIYSENNNLSEEENKKVKDLVEKKLANPAF